MSKKAYPSPLPVVGGGHAVRRRYRDAYERVRAEIDAVPDDKLLPVTIDVPSMVTALAGRMEALASLRDEVLTLPQFRVATFDDIETYALALGHAHTLYKSASTPTPIPRLVTELTRLRTELVADAHSLARRGHIAPENLLPLRRKRGHKNLAFDIMLVCKLLRDAWSSVDGRTGLLEAELDRADELADRLVTALGLREQRERVLSEAILTRQRAFTLFVRAYSEVRRAVTFLRWDKPVIERLAPSLYTAQRRARKKPKGGTPAGDDVSSGDAGVAGAPSTSPMVSTSASEGASVPANASQTETSGLDGHSTSAG